MAGKPSSRLTNRQQAAVVKHIKTSMIVKRLVLHTLADQDVMTTSQVNAAKILLNKVMPDLRAIDVDMSSDDGSMSPKEITIKLVDASKKINK